MFWKNRKHLYYVVYSYSTQSESGVASVTVETDYKLNSGKAVKKVQETLCKGEGCESVAILNWKKPKN